MCKTHYNDSVKKDIESYNNHDGTYTLRDWLGLNHFVNSVLVTKQESLQDILNEAVSCPKLNHYNAWFEILQLKRMFDPKDANYINLANLSDVETDALCLRIQQTTEHYFDCRSKVNMSEFFMSEK